MNILKLLTLVLTLISCQSNTEQAVSVAAQKAVVEVSVPTEKHPEGMTVQVRFSPPRGYARIVENFRLSQMAARLSCLTEQLKIPTSTQQF